ncbi:MAG: hypothetical protein KC933_38190, partial [Myxococcales bacterium]|nr:hypothetical protein [Myxococcales bacterium]
FRGIHAYCGSAHLRDLDVRDTGGDAVSLVEVRPATVERLAASDAAGFGLFVDGTVPVLQLVDCGPTEGEVEASDVAVETETFDSGSGGFEVVDGGGLRAERFRVRGGQVGLHIEELGVGYDLDEPEDLERALLDSQDGRAPRTRAAIRAVLGR